MTSPKQNLKGVGLGSSLAEAQTLAGLWSPADGGAGESFLEGKRGGCEEPRGEGTDCGNMEGSAAHFLPWIEESLTDEVTRLKKSGVGDKQTKCMT